MEFNILLKILIAVLISIVIIGILVFIVNKVSVYPTIYFLRFLERLNKSSVTIATYETDVSLVHKKRTVYVEDDNIYNPLPSISISMYGLEDAKSSQALVFFIHGGGWSIGNESQISDYSKLIASNGYLVASPNYALAPEHPYPTSTRQLMMALNHLYKHASKYQIDPDNIYIMGNSAGAHLGAQCASLICDEAYSHQVNVKPLVPQESLKGLILFNGVYDFKLLENVRFPFLRKLAWSYTGSKDYRTYDKLEEMSVINYINKHFPSTFVTVGDQDPLFQQSEILVHKLKYLKINYEAILWKEGHDLSHDYMYHLNKEESKEVYHSLIDFINNNLGRKKEL